MLALWINSPLESAFLIVLQRWREMIREFTAALASDAETATNPLVNGPSARSKRRNIIRLSRLRLRMKAKQ
jgi:hypothetical protein